MYFLAKIFFLIKVNSKISNQLSEIWLKLINLQLSHVRTKIYAISYANNKSDNQPALLRSLISAFAVPWLDSIIPKVATPEIPRCLLASVTGVG